MENKLDKDTIQKLIKLGLLNEHEFNMKMLESDNVEYIENTIPYLYNSYMDSIKGFSYSTRGTYKYGIDSFFTFIYEKDTIEEVFKLYTDHLSKQITYQDVKNWLDYLNVKVTHSTKRIYKLALQNFFIFVNSKHIEYFPDIKSIKILANEKDVTDVALREEDIIGISKCTDKKQDEFIIMLIYQLGMKRDELRNLKTTYMNFEEGFIDIYKPNGSLDRKGELTHDLIKLAKEYLNEKLDTISKTNETRRNRTYRTGEPYNPIMESEYLFQSFKYGSDERINPSTLNRIVKKAAYEYYVNKLAKVYKGKVELEEAVEEKVSTITIEMIRDSRRVNLLANGIPEQKVMAIMGDTNITFTRRYYRAAQTLYPEMFKIG